jgi:uncharacterized BrkB/YihY/UPF0761 family membrane protein
LRRIRAVIFDAVTHFNNDDGWAMASHVALSILMALFPFMIFGTSLASFLGAHAYADTASHLIFDTWPDSIAAPISREVVNVLTIERGGLLTLSVLAAAFFSANGVEALRVSLNRAYRVTETRAWYVTRAQSLGFVVIAVMVIMAISFLLVLAPLVLRLARQFAPWMETLITAVDNWRILIAVTVLIVGLVMSHHVASRREAQAEGCASRNRCHAGGLGCRRPDVCQLPAGIRHLRVDLCRPGLDHDGAGVSLHHCRDLHPRGGDQCGHPQGAGARRDAEQGVAENLRKRV